MTEPEALQAFRDAWNAHTKAHNEYQKAYQTREELSNPPKHGLEQAQVELQKAYALYRLTSDQYLSARETYYNIKQGNTGHAE